MAKLKRGARPPKRRQPQQPPIPPEAIADAEAEADRQIAARDEYARAFDEIAEYRNGFVRQIHALRARHGRIEDMIHNGERDPELVRRWKLIHALQAEIEVCDRELAELDFRTGHAGERAFDAVGKHPAETREGATWRILLERGATPYQVARAFLPGADSTEAGDSTVKKNNENLRARLLDFYQRILDEAADSIERARAGRVWSEHVPLDAVIGKLEARVEKMRALTDALRPRGSVGSSKIAK